MEDLSLRNKLNIGDTTFGVEIEFDEVNLENVKRAIEEDRQYKLDFGFDYDNWIVSTDNSITRGTILGMVGGEAISPILRDKSESYQSIEDVCDIIKTLGGETSDLTAGQIHIGANIIENNPRYLLNLIKLWIAYEDIIYKFGYNGSKPRRVITTYAVPLYMYMHHLNRLEKGTSMIDILEFIGNDRNYGINFKNLKNSCKSNGKYLNTIEVRCPNGTLDPIVWQNNINFFVKLFNYAKNDNYDTKLINERINLSNYPRRIDDAPTVFGIKNISKAEELSDLIFTDDLDKEYFIKQYKR